jgi:dephospho-CoA kinase
MDRMKIIGLVGGVASGKSRVGQMLAEHGARLLDADRIGHEVVAQDARVRFQLLERWGGAILAGDGSIDRAAIAGRVFGDSAQAAAERDFLENVLHPEIRRRVDEELRWMAANGIQAVVVDAPLLLEAGWGPMCDVVLMVDASRPTRLARALKRGWTEAHFDEREAAQWPMVKKREAADVVINNDGSEEELRRSVNDFWNEFVAQA